MPSSKGRRRTDRGGGDNQLMQAALAVKRLTKDVSLDDRNTLLATYHSGFGLALLRWYRVEVIEKVYTAPSDHEFDTPYQDPLVRRIIRVLLRCTVYVPAPSHVPVYHQLEILPVAYEIDRFECADYMSSMLDADQMYVLTFGELIHSLPDQRLPDDMPSDVRTSLRRSVAIAMRGVAVGSDAFSSLRSPDETRTLLCHLCFSPAFEAFLRHEEWTDVVRESVWMLYALLVRRPLPLPMIERCAPAHASSMLRAYIDADIEEAQADGGRLASTRLGRFGCASYRLVALRVSIALDRPSENVEHVRITLALLRRLADFYQLRLRTAIAAVPDVVNAMLLVVVGLALANHVSGGDTDAPQFAAYEEPLILMMHHTLPLMRRLTDADATRIVQSGGVHRPDVEEYLTSHLGFLSKCRTILSDRVLSSATRHTPRSLRVALAELDARTSDASLEKWAVNQLQQLHRNRAS